MQLVGKWVNLVFPHKTNAYSEVQYRKEYREKHEPTKRTEDIIECKQKAWKSSNK